jgi:PDDEXK-like domain of unknown function (DUF3799)
MKPITKPGIYDMPMADYLQDPCPEPSLSSSVAHLLCSASPVHAWTAHRRLNPTYQAGDDERFDIGTASHALLLEGAAAVEVIDAKDWRTAAAKLARDVAREAGKIPILAARWDDVQALVRATRNQLAAHSAKPIPFTDGRAEETLCWQEGPIWCRARTDWFHSDHATIDDFKSTGASANPEVWTRTMFGMGYDVQAALYSRGVRATFGTRPTFRFVVVETSPPYGLSVVSLAPDAMEMADRKVQYAIDTWTQCLAKDSWPGYTNEVAWAEAPPWEIGRWMDREYRERQPEPPVDDGRPLNEQLFGERA